MKLISLNIDLFKANNKLLTEFLKDQKADFVCLQEAARSLEKSVDKKYASLEAINLAIPDLKYFFFGPSSVMGNFKQKNFHGKKVFRFKFGGLIEFGNYTKSRYKIIKGQNVFVENCFTYSTDHSNWPEEDYRAVLITDHKVKEKKLRVLNYHGIWTRNKLGNERSFNANKIINNLALQSKGEVIICGDFNLFPDTTSMKIFEKNFISLVDKFDIKKTRPSSNELSASKRNVVDYIWVSSGIKIKNFEVIDTDISDHLPLLLDFDF